MTSREECEKAYLYLLKHCYEATKKNDTYDFAPSGFKESEVFKQLIEEHFEPKENTEEYKHFKLHSDSSLKNLTKVELIDYIKMLYHNWGVADEQLAHSLNAYNNLEEKYKSIDFTLDKQFEHIEEIEKILDVCGIVAIKERIKELTNIKPYKFEDLKPNMWLWNDKRKRCFRLTDAFIRAGTKYYRWLDLSSGKLVRERFVEGQLYPPTKAMEYQEGN